VSATHPTEASPSPCAEWDRVELLAQCTAQLRQGNELDAGVLERLRSLQVSVEQGRRDGEPWRRLALPLLSKLEYDILACALAPEVEPRVGWLFRQLQPGAQHPYPSPALLQELLALAPGEVPTLTATLTEEAPLRRLGLIEADESGPFVPLRPASGLAARLLGLPPPAAPPPPGAIQVKLSARWDELVLPANRLAMLVEFLNWVRHRRRVVDEWGGRPIGGPVALFAGPPGTGKTFAASVIAGELGWPLYRVDIGSLVSKYIGETEKNLNRLFSAAQGRPMVLLFDEADSLFGKRGEIREARDRYANLEVSHLLARIEQHEGPCILTTNLRGHIDPAFARRFQIVCDFPRPEIDARAQMWRIYLPPRAPRAEGIDFDLIARAVALTGGGIRNAALHAAYLAAGGGGVIGRAEIALAVWRELAKDGRSLARSDLGPIGSWIPEDTIC
jgi:hypothetical protein